MTGLDKLLLDISNKQSEKRLDEVLSLGAVNKVYKEKNTCEVTLLGTQNIVTASLLVERFVDDKKIKQSVFYPEEGSCCLVYTRDENDRILIHSERLESANLYVGKNKVLISKESFVLESGGELILRKENGDKSKLEITELLTKLNDVNNNLNALQEKVNDLITKYNAHTHTIPVLTVATAVVLASLTGTGSTLPGIAPATTSVETALAKTIGTDNFNKEPFKTCLLYTSDAADE